MSPASSLPKRSASGSIDTVLANIDAIDAEGGDGQLRVTRNISLDVTNLGKHYFPDDDITKGDIMRYYTWMSPYILPILRDRPLSMRRFPNGISGDFFYQQKAPPNPPKGVRVESIRSEADEIQERLIGGTLATLLYCVQLGAFECNPWNARVQSASSLDYAVIDLDPGPKVPFSAVVETALWVHEAILAEGLHGIAKTSGVSGIHIFLPLARATSEAATERVSAKIANQVATAHPKTATVARATSARRPTQIYVDAGQNSRGKTVSAAYSVRASPGALVSTPLLWEELTPSFDPTLFSVLTLPDRMATVGDLWDDAFRRPPNRLSLS